MLEIRRIFGGVPRKREPVSTRAWDSLCTASYNNGKDPEEAAIMIGTVEAICLDYLNTFLPLL